MPWERVILLQRLLALKKWIAHPHVSYIFGFCSMSGSHRHPQNLPKSLQVVARADLAAPLDCPLWRHLIVHFCPWRVISISATVFLEISLCICSPLYWIPFLVGWFLSYVQSNSFRWKNNVKVADNIAEDMEGEEEITAGVILCRTWVIIGTAAYENYEAIRTQHMSLVTSEHVKKAQNWYLVKKWTTIVQCESFVENWFAEEHGKESGTGKCPVKTAAHLPLSAST